ncbi:hypothetical protein ACHEVM_23415, partial [Roseomonas sp. SXEYE002]|uniref:hypothetical protein n=1 Tax=Roseomonas xinghualingensis TaxID=2986475 RepID=UPI0021F1DA9F
MLATARNAVLQSMLRAGLLEKLPAPDDGTTIALRITAAGLAAVGEAGTAEASGEAAAGAWEAGEGQPAIAPPEVERAPAGPPIGSRPAASSRAAATALLVAWDAGVERSALSVSVEALRAALSRAGASRPARDPSA